MNQAQKGFDGKRAEHQANARTRRSQAHCGRGKRAAKGAIKWHKKINYKEKKDLKRIEKGQVHVHKLI